MILLSVTVRFLTFVTGSGWACTGYSGVRRLSSVLDVIRHRFTFSSLLAAAAARPDPVWLLDGSFFFRWELSFFQALTYVLETVFVMGRNHKDQNDAAKTCGTQPIMRSAMGHGPWPKMTIHASFFLAKHMEPWRPERLFMMHELPVRTKKKLSIQVSFFTRADHFSSLPRTLPHCSL